MNQSFINPQGSTQTYKQQYSSAQILQIMKKKPFSQYLNGIQYSYSILNKKQQTFFFSNNRFLYLKGIQSISYARQFPQNQSLPFTNIVQIPKPKVTFPISDIEKITNDQQKLIIYFSGEKKMKWQFICPSKVCALQWRKKLDYAIQEYLAFSQSGFSKYQQYLKNKEMLQDQKYNQFNLVNKLLQSDVKSVHTNQPSIQHHISQKKNNLNLVPQQSNVNPQSIQTKEKKAVQEKIVESVSIIQPSEILHTLIVSSKEENKILNPFQFKPSQSNISQKSSKEIQPPSKQLTQNDNFPRQPQKQLTRPTTVLFKGPQIITKVQNFILQDSPQPQFLSRSIANLPKQQKQNIKNQITKLRRNWSKQILEVQDEVELIINFKNYAHKIGEVIINELYLQKQMRMYPPNHQQKQYNSYLLEDVQVQVYFYSESNLNYYPDGGFIQKNPKYKETVVQFKNFDYLIGQTKNQGILKVPLMILFQYKGFLGMVKSRIYDASVIKNRQVFEQLDKEQFQAETNISASVLLNQQKCRIVCEKPTSFSKKQVNLTPQAYFIQKLVQFLPTEQIKDNQKLLRPQFIQDEQFDDNIFRDDQRSIKVDKIHQIILRKAQELIEVLQNYQDYFTNSKQFSEIIHSFGLNMRHLGIIYKKAKRSWLRKIVQAEIIARCAKKFFRLDLQHSVLQPIDKLQKKQRQHERERNRVISFLNIVFGSNEVTLRMWRNFNHTAQTLYNIKIWDTQFTNINIPYLLQAIQTNFKIILGSHIHQKQFFKDMDTFEGVDFQRFEFDSTYYNLDFTEIFNEIHECLEQETNDSFHKLCDILISQSSSGIPYFNLLKNHPIHDNISQFLLHFTSPQQNQELYNRIQSKNLPSRFTYQSKLAEIKWLLKFGKHDNINKSVNFIEEHTKKWLGPIHPIFTKLNRILAQFFSQQESSYQLAIKYANISLQQQKALFQGDCQQIWKDYFLVGKIYYQANNLQESLKYLSRAKQLVNPQNLPDYQIYGELHLTLARCFLKAKYFKESYSLIRQFYNMIRGEKDERSLTYIIQCVGLIKYLLDLNQQHDSYFHFIESDFSSILHYFTNNEILIKGAIKMIAIPSMKNTILKNTKNRGKILNIINQIFKTSNNSSTSFIYLRLKISEGIFPKNFLNSLKEIDNLIQQMQTNQMVERWLSFNKIANQSLLEKIGGSQISKGFQFLANLTAILNLLGTQAMEQLFVMQK